MILVSFERVSLVEYACQIWSLYLKSSKVIAKVKVDNRQTNWQDKNNMPPIIQSGGIKRTKNNMPLILLLYIYTTLWNYKVRCSPKVLLNHMDFLQYTSKWIWTKLGTVTTLLLWWVSVQWQKLDSKDACDSWSDGNIVLSRSACKDTILKVLLHQIQLYMSLGLIFYCTMYIKIYVAVWSGVCKKMTLKVAIFKISE